MKFLLNIFYNLLKSINFIIKFFFNREFLLHVSSLIEKDAYKKKIILGKKITFFVPNELINWRVNTLFLKEPETIEWINSFKNNNKFVFWDIGSNIGLYSIYTALRHKKVEVVSFEPSTSNLRVLTRNISINKLEDRINVCQLPLSNELLRFQKLHETSFQEGFSQNTFGKKIDFKGKKLKTKNTYKILGTTIDHLINNRILSFPNYIKIDVDGIEHFILKGGIRTLADKRVRSLLIEVNENFIEQSSQVNKIMKDTNFKLRKKLRAEEFYLGNYNKTYNYIFEKK